MRVDAPDARTFLACFLICALDAVWFGLTLRRCYPPLDAIVPLYGSLAWVCLGLAIGAGRPTTAAEAFAYGACVGGVVYGTFNGTEAAIRPDWRGAHIVLDVAWGALVCASSSLVSWAVLASTSRVFVLVLGVVLCLFALGSLLASSNLENHICARAPCLRRTRR